MSRQQPHVAAAWWRDLQGIVPGKPERKPADRATLAQLRHCATVTEAMQHRAAIELFRRCGATHAAQLPEIALTAATLAHVRADVPDSTIASGIGPETPDKPETALLKPLRFRRLLEAESPDERLTAFRRLVALAGGRLNVTDLADALLHWTEGTKRRWIYDYWKAGRPLDTLQAAPKTEDSAA
ncbi:type I-E CRISPR-associated protein Cse2/CasB [Pseudoroseomonas wenyumeiae]